ncbi:MAG: S8 family serine peptidase, partial [Chlorobi bacterium]|nr:S8 family serine peptidase [Chlorobiota bacterium]
MEKRTILVFVIAFSISASSLGQEYYFYHFNEKMIIKPYKGYISVKFEENTAQNDINNVYNSLTSYSDKRIDFTTRLDNGSSSPVLLLKIKKEVSTDHLNLLKSNLAADRRVKSVGMCFTYNDKVLHFTTDEIIVKFKKNVTGFDIQSLNRLYKTNIIEQISSFENTYLLSVDSNSTDNVFEVSSKYSITQLVEFAQPNFIRLGMLLDAEFESVPPYMPNDTMIPNMWHIRNTGNNIPDSIQGIPGCDMNMLKAWDITTGNPTVLIAIVDTGIDTNHSDLRDNLCDRTLWYDAYDNNQRPYDQHYHGTGVSGTALAVGNNIQGTAGVAFNCRVMPVRVFGPFPAAATTDLILGKGLNWAWMHGASIINCSWGGGIPTPMITHAIQNAVNYGRNNRGTIVFGGAGNDDTDSVIYPASMPEVIGVGGLSPCNERKNPTSCDTKGGHGTDWGACYGNDLSLVAPTTYIYTTTLFGGWGLGSGTSVASPLAAAVGALMLSRNIYISGDSVRLIIERTAKKVGNYSYNVVKENGLWNYEMGYGRIDADSCLKMTPAGPNQTYERVPPIINIFPPESRVYNNPISVYADIYDNAGVGTGLNSPRLYYRTLQTNNLQVIIGSKISQYRFRFTFPLIPYSEGLFYYIAAQDVTPVPNFMTYPLGGAGVNPPGTIPPPKLMFVRNTSTVDSFYLSSDVPKPIIANSETTFVSVLNNPVSRMILDVNCAIDIQHTYDADLNVSLTSPSGTEIVLVAGTGGDGDNFTNTYFDDEAALSIDSSSAQAPYTGVFKPIERLWLLDGENSSGIWKL